MLQHYFKIATRNLLKYKLQSLISMIGLALGFTSFALANPATAMKILLLAIRSLLRFRLYTLINILGLALSLACVIIISRYVYSEATTDHFCTNHERIYLSVRHWPNGEQIPRFLTMDNILMKRDYNHPLDIPEVAKKHPLSLFMM